MRKQLFDNKFFKSNYLSGEGLLKGFPVGYISEKTGLQKKADGSWKKPETQLDKTKGEMIRSKILVRGMQRSLNALFWVF